MSIDKHANQEGANQAKILTKPRLKLGIIRSKSAFPSVKVFRACVAIALSRFENWKIDIIYIFQIVIKPFNSCQRFVNDARHQELRSLTQHPPTPSTL